MESKKYGKLVNITKNEQPKGYQVVGKGPSRGGRVEGANH